MASDPYPDDDEEVCVGRQGGRIHRFDPEAEHGAPCGRLDERHNVRSFEFRGVSGRFELCPDCFAEVYDRIRETQTGGRR